MNHPLLAISSVRTRALDAATNILAAEGAEALSLRAVAETAGIGLASIYHYFASKEQLLLSLALTGFEDLRRAMAAASARRGSVAPSLGARQAFIDFVQTRRCVFLLMFDERLMARNKELRDAEDRTILTYQASVEADGDIPPDQHANVAHAMWAIGRGAAAILASRPGIDLSDALMQRVCDGVAFLIGRDG